MKVIFNIEIKACHNSDITRFPSDKTLVRLSSYLFKECLEIPRPQTELRATQLFWLKWDSSSLTENPFIKMYKKVSVTLLFIKLVFCKTFFQFLKHNMLVLIINISLLPHLCPPGSIECSRKCMHTSTKLLIDHIRSHLGA